MSFPRLFALTLAVLPLVLHGGERRPPPLVLTIHSEAEARDSEKFARPVELRYARRMAYITTMPDLSDRDVFDVMPFPAADGTQGAHLRLSPSGRLRLEALSGSKLGKAVVVFARGVPIVDLHIDRRIEDGIFPVPSGLTAGDIEALRKSAEHNRRQE